MSDEGLERRAAELREAFDRAFALPLVQLPRDEVELVVVKAGGASYGIRTSELIGLEVDRRIVPLPSARAGLLGLCSARDELVAVFELAVVLGGPAANNRPRWIALHRDKELVALAFDELLQSRRVPARDIVPLGPEPGHQAMSRQPIRVETEVIHVLDISAIVSGLYRNRKSQQD